MKLDDGSNRVSRDFGINAQDGLRMQADLRVCDGLGACQLRILEHLVHGRGLCFGLRVASDAENVGRRSFAGDRLDDRKVVLRKNDVCLQLVLIGNQTG